MSISKYVSEAIERADSWLNATIGLGGQRDKASATRFCGVVEPLSDGALAAMFQTEDLSAKIVDVYPQEAMSEGFELDAGDEGDEDAIVDYLERFNVSAIYTDADIWSRLFGGGLIWVMTDSDDDPSLPLPESYVVAGLKFVDRRYACPAGSVYVDAMGEPTAYDIYPDGVLSTLALSRSYRVHVSRLVRLGGARTEKQIRVQLNGWDLSVLQRPYNALRSDGAMWRSIENLTYEASTGVISIRGLSAMMGGGQKDKLLERLRLIAINRSIVKDTVLNGGMGPNDDGKEEYRREAVQFAGLPDLSEKSLQRVAAAAEVPVTILLGQAPAGLNATGDSDLRWFLKRVNAYRLLRIAPPLTRLLRILFGASDAPALEKIVLRWPELWGPNAKERSEIYAANAQADIGYIQQGVLLPEEVGLSRFGDDGYSQEMTIDRELREAALEADKPKPAEDGQPPAAVPGAPGAAPPAEGDVQKTAMNGAQVASLVDVVAKVAAKEISREAGVQIIALAFQITPEQATQLLGPETFEPVKPPAPAPFGGAPPGKGEPPAGGKGGALPDEEPKAKA